MTGKMLQKRKANVGESWYLFKVLFDVDRCIGGRNARLSKSAQTRLRGYGGTSGVGAVRTAEHR